MYLDRANSHMLLFSPPSAVKQELQSLPKVGKQHPSKEHSSSTYLPAPPGTCDREQGPRVSFLRDPVARQCLWGSQAELFVFLGFCLKGKAHAEPWLWRLPLHGNLVRHPLSPARKTDCLLLTLCLGNSKSGLLCRTVYVR